MVATADELEFIDDTLNEVRRDWNVMMQDEFNPIMIALEMLQQSNPAHDLESFMRLDEQLEQCMEIIINNYYSGFNNAVSIFSGVVENVNECRQSTEKMQNELGELVQKIAYQRPDLPELAAKKLQVQAAVDAASKEATAEKKRLEASDLLGKRSFVKASTAFTECLRLVNELGDEGMDSSGLKKRTEETKAERMLKCGFLTKAASLETIDESRSTLTYVKSIMVAADSVGLGKNVIKSILQRLPKELQLISSRILNDTFDQYKRNWHPSASVIRKTFSIRARDCTSADIQEIESFAPFLVDCLEQIFIVFAVVEGSLTSGLGHSVSMTDTYTKSIRTSIITEARNVISVFISTSELNKQAINPIVGITEALKNKVNKSKSTLYSFSCKINEDELPPIIKTLSPSLSEKEGKVAEKVISMEGMDPQSSLLFKLSHTAPVKSSIQYLPIMADPFLMLLEWIDEKDDFLEGLVRAHYLPFLDAHVSQEMLSAFNSPDSMLWQDLSSREESFSDSLIGRNYNCVLKCVLSFVSLIDTLSAALYYLSIVQSEIEAFLSNICDQFVEKCEQKYQELVAHSQRFEGNESTPATIISAQFAGNDDIRALLLQHPLLVGEADDGFEKAMAIKEITLMELVKMDRSLHRTELIFSHKVIRKLCLLHLSLSRLPKLLETADGSGNRLSVIQYNSESGDLACSYLGVDPNEAFLFSPDFTSSYRDFVRSVDRLSRTCLLTLRCELRAQCMYFLDLAFREGHYNRQNTGSSPTADSYVTELSSKIVYLESVIDEWFDIIPYSFVMDGLSATIQSIMINNVRYLKHLAPDGVSQLLANVTALEQMVAIVSTGPVQRFEKVREYFRLIGLDGDSLMAALSSDKARFHFTLSEYQTLLQVKYGGMGDTERAKELSNQLVRLKYLFEESTAAAASKQ